MVLNCIIIFNHFKNTIELEFNIHLVMAYSRKPLCKAIELNVPIHPLSFLSMPVSHVTNRGLKQK